VVDEGDDRLVFLSDEGDEVGFTVAVKVGDRDVNRSVTRIHNMGNELRMVPVGGAVFENGDVAALEPAEDGNDKVQLTVAVEVGGLHIGDAAHALEQGDRGVKTTRFLAAQPDDSAARLVGGREIAEVGDNEVLDAIAIQINHFDMRR